MENNAKRDVFRLLWDMVNQISKGNGGRDTGMIIGRYAGLIDDRIENSGYSRSVDSLKLYTIEQLQEEINSREGCYE